MIKSNQENNIDNLIAGFLSGEATGEEQTQLLQRIKSGSDHQEYYEQMRNAWLSSAQVGKLPVEQVEQALQQTKNKIYTPSIAEMRRQTRKEKKSMWLRGLFKYAAAIVLLIVGTYGLTQLYMNQWFERQSSEMVYEAHYGSRGYAVLPDNTKVWLNSGSKLTFQSDYNFRERKVQLTGEAYFEVQTNPDKPFVVKAGNINIKATGTIFNVKAYPEEDRITTTLVEGIVTIEGTDDRQKEFALKMSPNQSVSYYKQQAVFEDEITKKEVAKTEMVPENKPEYKPLQSIPAMVHLVKPEVYTSWTSHRWMIDRESFGSLAIKLERRYDVKIHFDSDELKKYHFTGTIERETLEQMFDVFRYSIPLRYSIDKGVVNLTVDEQLKKRYEKAWKQDQSSTNP